jgi:hypothetical protein
MAVSSRGTPSGVKDVVARGPSPGNLTGPFATATCHARLEGSDRSVCGRDPGGLTSILLTWAAVAGGSFSPDLHCARCVQALQRDATGA